MAEELRAVFYKQFSIPTLLNPKEAANQIFISEERLMDLAKAGYAPCAVVDKENYYFYRKDILEWAKDQLWSIQSAKPIPTDFRVVVPEKVNPYEIPESLTQIGSRLKTIGFSRSGPCVYFLVERGEVIYVGQSTNILNRIGQHMSDKAFDRIYYIPLSEEILFEVETAFIKILKPRLNLVHNCGEAEEIHFDSIQKLKLKLLTEGLEDDRKESGIRIDSDSSAGA